MQYDYTVGPLQYLFNPLVVGKRGNELLRCDDRSSRSFQLFIITCIALPHSSTIFLCRVIIFEATCPAKNTFLEEKSCIFTTQQKETHPRFHITTRVYQITIYILHKIEGQYVFILPNKTVVITLSS